MVSENIIGQTFGIVITILSGKNNNLHLMGVRVSELFQFLSNSCLGIIIVSGAITFIVSNLNYGGE